MELYYSFQWVLPCISDSFLYLCPADKVNMKIKKYFVRLLIGVFWTCLVLELPQLFLNIAWPDVMNDALWLLGPTSCCALIIRWFYVKSRRNSNAVTKALYAMSWLCLPVLVLHLLFYSYMMAGRTYEILYQDKEYEVVVDYASFATNSDYVSVYKRWLGFRKTLYRGYYGGETDSLRSRKNIESFLKKQN